MVSYLHIDKLKILTILNIKRNHEKLNIKKKKNNGAPQICDL